MNDSDKSWHLCENADEKGITEFTLQLWRLFWAFNDWIETCQKNSSDIPLSGLEIAIIHTIRQKDKAKTLSDLGRILNRSDSHSIRYSIKKLLKHQLIKKLKGAGANQKTITFGITEKGIKITTDYTMLRKKALIPLAALCQEELGFVEMSEKFVRIKTLFEEAERSATTYSRSHELAVDE